MTTMSKDVAVAQLRYRPGTCSYKCEENHKSCWCPWLRTRYLPNNRQKRHRI